jgi:hypothetical protein
MTETVSRGASSAEGWNEPTKNLPPLKILELPEPVPLGKLIGASVILLATALGSGDLLIWPHITTKAGVGLLSLATLGFLSQYFLNLEIERESGRQGSFSTGWPLTRTRVNRATCASIDRLAWASNGERRCAAHKPSTPGS